MCATNPSGLVLVVEDEWLVRDVIASDFKDAGWHVLEASSGESALGIIEANRISTCCLRIYSSRAN